MARPLLDSYEEQLEAAGFTLLPISSQHARHAGSFPAKHGDPFDRMLAAQAFLENLTLLSNDPQLDHFHIQRTW
jgi:PIN domain nuclease of toxin-antitoxin system